MEVGICRDGGAAARVLGGSKGGGVEQSKEHRVKQGRKVTDICTWVQCFGTYVAVLVPAEPLVVPELMAYMYGDYCEGVAGCRGIESGQS